MSHSDHLVNYYADPHADHPVSHSSHSTSMSNSSDYLMNDSMNPPVNHHPVNHSTT